MKVSELQSAFRSTLRPGLSLVNEKTVLWALALLGLVAYGGLAGIHLAHGTLRAGQTPATLAWYALAFLAYAGALAWVERRGRIAGGLLWGMAVAYRLILLLTTPTLSDDVYRYIWDGHVANHGVSPYAYALNAPELDSLDVPQRALANNTWMASPYLPAAQFVFAGLTRLFPLYPIFFQAAMVIFDLAAVALIGRLLVAAGLPWRRVLVYAWNPLVVVEVAHGAHVDAWMVLLVLLGVWLALRVDDRRVSRAKPGHATDDEGWTADDGRWTMDDGRRSAGAWVVAPVFLALATLTKLLPGLLLVVLFWRWRWRPLIVYSLVTAGLLLPAGLRAGWGLAGPLGGTGLFGALRIYGDQWNFNSGLFHWLEVALHKVAIAEANALAKAIVGLAMLVLLLLTWWLASRCAAPRAALRLMAIPLAAYVLLTTTVHPWYLLLLLAFAPFLAPAAGEPGRRWLLLLPWLYLSAAVALSYLTYVDPANFRELEWVRQVEWLPTLALLVVALSNATGVRGY
ncbi:MAG: hypothetical protein L0332_18310 [Chloroflexi bacterium]|nr:hypothetical protein [Chloroflexota bacterium]MCI0578037.1 hypothetical protein [Chloroflexota bacterium]MCI0644749.1 hypothetical protein [Chloroflexota bacterium]MCI0728654.1 hypothetical protein [Chloroflexota bacterium]